MIAQLRQNLAIAKVQETTLRQELRTTKQRLGFQSIRQAAASKKVREQVVKLTAALHEIQKRVGVDAGFVFVSIETHKCSVSMKERSAH